VEFSCFCKWRKYPFGAVCDVLTPNIEGLSMVNVRNPYKCLALKT
jgi:hypothetical protein